MPPISHLSFSSIKDALECPLRFKLKHIDKLKSFENSIDTIFGTILHNEVQDILQRKKTQKEARLHFWKLWKRFFQLYRKNLDESKVKKFLRAGLNILNHVDAAFRGCETLLVEERLELPISEEHPNINFKGFIDLVMFRDDKLIIADLKTCGSTYMFSKYLDEIKKYQLVFYKTYYSKKYDIDFDDIDTCFITMEKAPTSKSPISFLPEYAGKNKAEKSQNVIRNVLKMIQDDSFEPVLNENCFNPKTKIQCAFYKTEHCPKSKDLNL